MFIYSSFDMIEKEKKKEKKLRNRSSTHREFYYLDVNEWQFSLSLSLHIGISGNINDETIDFRAIGHFTLQIIRNSISK